MRWFLTEKKVGRRKTAEIILFFKKYLIYLFERTRKQKWGEGQLDREKQTPR